MPKSEGDLITTPQTITDSWADVGGEIKTEGYSFFASYIDLDINDSENVEFRYVTLLTSGGDEYELPLRIIKEDIILIDRVPFQINVDEDQKIPISTDIDGSVAIIKLQVRALTVGATAGVLTVAKYKQGYRQ